MQGTNNANLQYTIQNGSAWSFSTTAGPGYDDNAAGNAGWLKVVNNSTIDTLASNSDNETMSTFNMLSQGGTGDQSNENDNSDGGKGGSGGTITFVTGANAGYNASGYVAGGFAVFDGISRGGQGGAQNDSIFSDQRGGAGGAGGAFAITSGLGSYLKIGSSTDPFTGQDTGGGVIAKSFGGEGGFNNGNAGSGGAISITGSLATEIYWYLSETGGTGLFGLSGLSQGGNGTTSTDNSDQGGDGGNGGAVTITNDAAVVLEVGDDTPEISAAIAAKSLGGDGGTGPSKDQTGGNGGAGGDITLGMSGSSAEIRTTGNNVYGILGQSIGGEGGDGGDGTALAGTGGGGGYGGNAGSINVTLSGTADDKYITTAGDYAAGIAVHSIGGGGGTGGDFVSVLGGQAGNGGNGGNGGAVTVNSDLGIETSGDHAFGIVAQSIAGSGGTGGIDTSTLVGLGGDGAGGGSAGRVTVNTDADITTAGFNALGVIAQSIGGGGGAAGSSNGLVSIGGSAEGTTVSNGTTVGFSNLGNISTAGDSSIAALVQSIGGGGGSGGDANGVAGVGGSGSAGGAGGPAVVANLGGLRTTGEFSHGLVAQSVGGGGGNGGSTLTLSAGVSVGVGGSAASGGTGGVICIDNTAVCGTSNSDGTVSPYASGLSAPGIGLSSSVATTGNSAIGLVAQSIGGGGGNGGSVKNYSLASFLALQVGGAGGDGGSSNSVSIRQDKLALSTSGAQSHGIVAQSIGGGGGNGGSASNYDATIGLNVAFVLGGSAGDGGDGGMGPDNNSSTDPSAVSLDLTNSSIFTGNPAGFGNDTFNPNDAIGIVAQSIGGGGGNGGATTASDLVVAAPTGTGVPVAVNYQAAIGGNGGNGGAGKKVSVAFSEGTSVTTLGDGSHGLLAQSIGGGGGNGGDSSVLSTTLGDKDTVEVTAGVSLGGGSGNILTQFNPDYAYATSGGGYGGTVDLTLGDSSGSIATVPVNTVQAPGSTVRTYGDGANAIIAQSIGGGGGNGGAGNSNAYTQGGGANLKLTIGLGGAGGTGGNGGIINLNHNADYTLQTLGSGSRAIVGQSIGGGGGTSQGGTMNISAGVEGYAGRLSLGVGLTGGSGGAGDTVNLTSFGRIQTSGGDADGIVLQSIGGGGGIGGSLGADASSHSILDKIGQVEDNLDRLSDKGNTYTFTVDVGGSGGDGGGGGDVNLTYGGQIATAGDLADAIVLQSISGGGGQGGSSSASGSQVQANITVGVGGKGGTSDNAGTITTYFNDSKLNSVNTNGYGSVGVLMQSIGGGGGQGGDGSDQAEGDITVGGSAGGTGGTGGGGGLIQSTPGNDSGWLNLTTQGDEAHGLVAQSIGGGGGVGGAGNSTSGAIVESHSVGLTVGGKGGVAGNGGNIDLAFGSALKTYGDRAHGFLLQSIGGGGGIASTGTVDGVRSATVGGTGGAAGDGNTINFHLKPSSRIYTYGDGAHAILAQSIGGGGGIAGDTTQTILSNLTPNLIDAGGANGNGGEIIVTWDGGMHTTGDRAFGVFAQSIGGGGGLVGDQTGVYAGVTSQSGTSTGSGGAITINANDDLTTNGNGSVAIFAQSEGPSGSGAVNITVSDTSTVIGGSGSDGAAVWVAGGTNSTLEINDTATVSSNAVYNNTGDDTNYAVRYNGSGTTAEGSILNVTVNDMGSLYGNIMLTNADGGNTAGTVTNNSQNTLAGGYFYGAHILNNGRFILGREHETGTTVLTGNFEQSDLGKLVIDTDLNASQSDLFDVQGNATLSGKLGINAVSLLPNRQTKFMTVAGTLNGAFTPQDSLIFDYEINTSGNDQYLAVTSADFTATGQNSLKSDQSRLAQNLQSIWNVGGNDSFGNLFGAIANEVDHGSGDYARTLDELRPQTALAPVVEQSFEMFAFSNSLMSCPVFEEGDASLTESSCGWARVSAGTGHRQPIGNSASYDADALTYTMGAQKEIAPGWYLGTAAAYQQSWVSQSSGSVSGDGNGGFVGVSLKHEMGDWTLSGAASGSYARFDIDRRISIPGVAETVSSSQDVMAGSVRARIARTFAASNTYIKPYVDLDAVYSWVDGYQETGTYGLQFDGTGQWNFAATPSLEVGSRHVYENGTNLRIYGRFGVTMLSNDHWDTTASFVSAPGGTGKFTTSLDHEDLYASIGAGVQLSSINGVDLRLDYEGRFSEKIATNSGSLRLSIPF